MDADERLLRYFVVLSEELHFRRAASRLFISQPALSKQIKGLEERLHLSLFIRTRRQVILTPAGAALLPLARSALEALGAFAAKADLLRRGQHGRLRVGFIAQAANEITPRLVRAFARSHPEVDVDLRQSALDDSSAGLRSAAVDLALVRLPIELGGLEVQPLLTERRVVVLPVEHHLASRTQVSLADLRGEPRLVTATADPAFRAFALEGALEDRAASPESVVSSVDEFLEAVLAGRGIAMAPESARRFYSRPGVTFVDVRDATPSVVALAWRADVMLPQAAQEFVALACRIAADRNPRSAEAG